MLSDTGWITLGGIATVVLQQFWKAYTDARARAWDRDDRKDAAALLAAKTVADADLIARKADDAALVVARHAQDAIDALKITLDEQTKQAAVNARLLKVQIDRNTQRLDETALRAANAAVEAAAERHIMAAKIDTTVDTIEKNAVVASEERTVLLANQVAAADVVAAALKTAQETIVQAHVALDKANGTNEKFIALREAIHEVKSDVSDIVTGALKDQPK
jgi:hypothetical protein